MKKHKNDIYEDNQNEGATESPVIAAATVLLLREREKHYKSMCLSMRMNKHKVRHTVGQMIFILLLFYETTTITLPYYISLSLM